MFAAPLGAFGFRLLETILAKPPDGIAASGSRAIISPSLRGFPLKIDSMISLIMSMGNSVIVKVSPDFLPEQAQSRLSRIALESSLIDDLIAAGAKNVVILVGRHIRTLLL